MADDAKDIDKDLEFLKKVPNLMAYKPNDKLIDFKLMKHKLKNGLDRTKKKLLKRCREAGFSKDEIIETLLCLIDNRAEDLASFQALKFLHDEELYKALKLYLDAQQELDELQGEKSRPAPPKLTLIKNPRFKK